jgi:hypothetical protein
MSLTFNLVDNKIYAIIQPPPPTITSVGQSDPNNILISWDNLSNLLTYNLICSDNTLNVYGIKTNSYSVTVTPGVSYTFQVVSVINTGIIPVSSDPSVASNPITYLSTPGEPAVSASLLGVSDSTGSITITWNEITGATKYNIIPSLSSISSIPGIVLNNLTKITSGITYNPGSPGSYSYTISNIPSGSISSFGIVAVSSDNIQSQKSLNSNSVTLLNTPNTPTVALSSNGSSIIINWTGVIGATSYYLNCFDSSYPSSPNPTLSITTSPGINSPYTFSTGTIGINYTFKIAAVANDQTISQYSSSSNSIKYPITPPLIPDLIWLKFDDTTYNSTILGDKQLTNLAIPLSDNVNGSITLNHWNLNGFISKYNYNDNIVSLIENVDYNNFTITSSVIKIVSKVGNGYSLCYWIYINPIVLVSSQSNFCSLGVSSNANTINQTNTLLFAGNYINSNALKYTRFLFDYFLSYGLISNGYNTNKFTDSTITSSSGSYSNYSNWMHISIIVKCTGSATSSMNVYKNNVNIYNATTTYPALNTTTDANFGIGQFSSSAYYSDVRLYSYPISDTTLTSIYNYGISLGINNIVVNNSSIPNPDLIWINNDDKVNSFNNSSGNLLLNKINGIVVTGWSKTSNGNRGPDVGISKSVIIATSNFTYVSPNEPSSGNYIIPYSEFLSTQIIEGSCAITSSNILIPAGKVGSGFTLCYWFINPSLINRTKNIGLPLILGTFNNNVNQPSQYGLNTIFAGNSFDSVHNTLYIYYYGGSISTTPIYKKLYHISIVQTWNGINSSNAIVYLNGSVVYNGPANYPSTDTNLNLTLCINMYCAFFDTRLYGYPLNNDDILNIYNYGSIALKSSP